MMKLIEKYIGIPFVHKGRTMKGLDCWGLIRLVYKDLGFEVAEIDDYEMEGHLQGHDHVPQIYADKWERVSVPVGYDVVLFLNQKGIAYHAGMILPDRRFIHCAKNTGVAIVNFSNVEKMMRVDGFYRLKARNDKNKI